jgi:Fe-S cluster assembly protein SufD
VREALPTRRVEAWKYSDLRAAVGEAELPPLALDAEAPIIARLGGGVEDVAVTDAAVRLERFEGDGLEARAVRFAVAPGASLTRIVLQTGAGVPLSYAEVRLAAGASFRQFVLAEGGRLARIETHVEVEGEGAEVELNGVYLAGAGRHADLTSRITHQVPNGKTSQLIKGAARAKGRGVFQGKILVARGAQHTDARQGHHALLLEEGAEIYAKPELEIYADDVACAHGNTAGALSTEQLFYLRARGIPQPQARALLVEAFLGEAVSDWLPESVREETLARIRAWLEAG